jgi:hypothetical protein
MLFQNSVAIKLKQKLVLETQSTTPGIQPKLSFGNNIVVVKQIFILEIEFLNQTG